MQDRRRQLLQRLMFLGVLTLFVGPCGYGLNEGFGGMPGPLAGGLFWRRATYILLPLGAVVAICAAIKLVIIDQREGNRDGHE